MTPGPRPGDHRFEPPEYALASIFENLMRDGWALVVGSNHPRTSAGTKEAKRAGVITYHEYTAVGYDAGAKTLDLRNPWGSESITGMSVATFKSVVEIGGVRVEVLEVLEGARGDGRVTIREL